jgi:hypothetical protein
MPVKSTKITRVISRNQVQPAVVTPAALINPHPACPRRPQNNPSAPNPIRRAKQKLTKTYVLACQHPNRPPPPPSHSRSARLPHRAQPPGAVWRFGVCESLTPRGLSISAYQAGLSAVTAVLECSIDQGVSWFSIPSTSTFYGTTTLTGDTAAIVANRYDVSELCGSQMRFGFTAATGLTSCPVYALQG